jgi:hypothetical protein
MYKCWLLTFIQGKNLRYYIQRAKKLENLQEGVSRNSLKTGKKQGRKSKEALKRKRQKFVEKKKVWAAQKAAQKAAEGKCGMFIHTAGFKLVLTGCRNVCHR